MLTCVCLSVILVFFSSIDYKGSSFLSNFVSIWQVIFLIFFSPHFCWFLPLFIRALNHCFIHNGNNFTLSKQAFEPQGGVAQQEAGDRTGQNMLILTNGIKKIDLNRIDLERQIILIFFFLAAKPDFLQHKITNT